MAVISQSCARFGLIATPRIENLTLGDDHPFQLLRYQLAFELLDELGLVEGSQLRLVACPPAPVQVLERFHRRDYLERLREFSGSGEPRADFRFGLGDVENPVFPGMYEWFSGCCGGTLAAARMVAEEGFRVVFNPAGGYHHAQPAKASGFSYLNDAAVAIAGLVEKGLRVAYLDIDAHHGDGVQQAFYDTDRVLTISLHETGKDFYPRTGFADELGEGRGYGYAVNVPFLRHADDLVFEQAFNRVVLPLLQAYRPDVLFTQIGVDGLRSDPLSRLEFTTRSYEVAAAALRELDLPWVILGGGGYDQVNVARGWAIFWGTVLGRTLPDRFPPRFAQRLGALGGDGIALRDAPHLAQPGDFARAQQDLERVLGFLLRRLAPVHGDLRRRLGA